MGREGVELPDSIEDLRSLVLTQQSLLEEQTSALDANRSALEESQERIETLEEFIRLLRQQRFGRKSEKAPVDQLGLFNEAEASTQAAEAEEGDEDEIDVPAHKRRKGGRRPVSISFRLAPSTDCEEIVGSGRGVQLGSRIPLDPLHLLKLQNNVLLSPIVRCPLHQGVANDGEAPKSLACAAGTGNLVPTSDYRLVDATVQPMDAIEIIRN